MDGSRHQNVPPGLLRVPDHQMPQRTPVRRIRQGIQGDQIRITGLHGLKVPGHLVISVHLRIGIHDQRLWPGRLSGRLRSGRLARAPGLIYAVRLSHTPILAFARRLSCLPCLAFRPLPGRTGL